MTLFLNTTLFSDFSSLLDIFIYLNSLINLIIEGGYYLCISLLVTGSLYYINYSKEQIGRAILIGVGYGIGERLVTKVLDTVEGAIKGDSTPSNTGVSSPNPGGSSAPSGGGSTPSGSGS